MPFTLNQWFPTSGPQKTKDGLRNAKKNIQTTTPVSNGYHGSCSTTYMEGENCEEQLIDFISE